MRTGTAHARARFTQHPKPHPQNGHSHQQTKLPRGFHSASEAAKPGTATPFALAALVADCAGASVREEAILIPCGKRTRAADQKKLHHLILHLGQCANRLGRWLDSIAPCYSFIGGHLDEMACVHHGYSVPMRCHYLDRVFFSLSVSTRSIAIDIYPLGERRSHLLMNPDDQNVSQSNPISHMADDWTPVYDGHDKSLRLIVVVHFV